jgi:hypothetical protein
MFVVPVAHLFTGRTLGKLKMPASNDLYRIDQKWPDTQECATQLNLWRVDPNMDRYHENKPVHTAARTRLISGSGTLGHSTLFGSSPPLI